MTARIAAILSLTASGLLAEPATTDSKRSFDEDPFPDKTIAMESSQASPWSFTIQPYGWLPALSGDIGVRGLPTSHIDYNARTLIKNLNWAVFLKAEARYGRWGLMADGFFVDLEANGDLDGSLYRSAEIGVEQGLAQLALAYRVIETPRGFIDLYAGARYNYLGLSLGAEQNSSGIQQIGDSSAQRISDRLSAETDRLVERDASLIATRVDSSVQAAREAAETQLSEVQKRIQVAMRKGEKDIEKLTALQTQLTTQIQSRVDSGLIELNDVRASVDATVQRDVEVARLERWAEAPREVRRTLERPKLERVFEPVRREFRQLVEAKVRQQLATRRVEFEQNLADQVVALGEQRVRSAEKLLERARRQGSREVKQAARKLVNASRAQLDSARDQRSRAGRSIDTKALEKEVEDAKEELADAITDKLEDELPENGSGDRWWVDPFVGVRAQVNLTRWLYLATQCDVGGFGAGSDIAWNLNGAIGVNWSRSFFTEVGYRYYYVDYSDSGVIYQVAESGIFLGAGIQF